MQIKKLKKQRIRKERKRKKDRNGKKITKEKRKKW